jgi:putative aldouronate transport system permease protein
MAFCKSASYLMGILYFTVRVFFTRQAQTILYLPHFLSWVVIASIAYQLFSPNSGIVNILINSFGGQSVPFLTEKWHWLLTYNLIGVWQSMGWGTIIYLASITGISSMG